MAALFDISVSHYERIKAGENSLSADKLQILYYSLGADLNRLVGDDADVDSDGYVYNGTPGLFSGFGADKCVGRVEGGDRMQGAAAQLLLADVSLKKGMRLQLLKKKCNW